MTICKECNTDCVYCMLPSCNFSVVELCERCSIHGICNKCGDITCYKGICTIWHTKEVYMCSKCGGKDEELAN